MKNIRLGTKMELNDGTDYTELAHSKKKHLSLCKASVQLSKLPSDLFLRVLCSSTFMSMFIYFYLG